MTTKRSLERRLEAVEENVTSEKDRLKIHFGNGFMYETEPKLTIALRSRGFVIEREERVHENGNEDVRLHTTPSTPDVFSAISWHHGGPTANHNDVRIIWEDERLEQVLADATYATEYAESDVPAGVDTTVVTEGEGWKAVVRADRVITNMVHRRSDAEYHGFEILGPVELPLSDNEKYDLVEVNADPDADRQPRLSG